MHEGLRIDILVVLGEIEAAFQRFVDNAAVIPAGETEFGLDRRAQ